MSLEWIILKDGQYHVFHIQCDEIHDDVELAQWLTFQLLDHHWLANTNWLSNFRFVCNYDPNATEDVLINHIPDIRDPRQFARWILTGGDLVTYYPSPLSYCPQIGLGVSYQLIMEGDKITFGTVDPGYWIQWSFQQLISYTQEEIFNLFRCVVNHWLDLEQQAEQAEQEAAHPPVLSPTVSDVYSGSDSETEMKSDTLSSSPSQKSSSSSSCSSSSSSLSSTRSSPRRRRRRQRELRRPGHRFVRRAAMSVASAVGMREISIGNVVEWLVDAVTSIFS